MTSESINAVRVHRLADSGPVLGSYASATDLIGEMYGQDVEMLVIPVGRLDPEFFRLASGLAGVFMEKLQQYGFRLAVVGDISAPLGRSKPLQDFVRETNRHGRHLFVTNDAELRQRLGG